MPSWRAKKLLQVITNAARKGKILEAFPLTFMTVSRMANKMAWLARITLMEVKVGKISAS